VKVKEWVVTKRLVRRIADYETLEVTETIVLTPIDGEPAASIKAEVEAAEETLNERLAAQDPKPNGVAWRPKAAPTPAPSSNASSTHGSASHPTPAASSPATAAATSTNSSPASKPPNAVEPGTWRIHIGRVAANNKDRATLMRWRDGNPRPDPHDVGCVLITVTKGKEKLYSEWFKARNIVFEVVPEARA
jgi:hypothetical protein